MSKAKMQFSILNPYVERNMIQGIEKIINSKLYVQWGENNLFPSYLQDLYNNVSTLQTIINTCTDYTLGNGVESTNNYITNEDAESMVYEIAKSYFIYGGFALNILRNKLGEISKVCVMDFKKIRSSKDGKTLFYAENYSEKPYARYNWKQYPKYNKDDKTQMSSIYYYKNSKYTTYPIPIYGAAITACEIEKSIDEYHLNAINNGFMGSVIVNLNNGVPTDEIQEEIEKNFNEKFSGKENSGRIVISYADDKEHQATIEKIDTEDFSERYKTLAERTRQTLFTAFRITPTLCGIESNQNGFSETQYNEQFKIFNRTVIYPIQKMIVRELTKIFGNDYFTIKPFSIDFDETNNEEKSIE